jgi:hypothetical protein
MSSRPKYNSFYGHALKNAQLKELIHFDGIVFRDDVKAGSKGAIYRHWQDCADFCEYIIKAHNHTHWLQINHSYHLKTSFACYGLFCSLLVMKYKCAYVEVSESPSRRPNDLGGSNKVLYNV